MTNMQLFGAVVVGSFVGTLAVRLADSVYRAAKAWWKARRENRSAR